MSKHTPSLVVSFRTGLVRLLSEAAIFKRAVSLHHSVTLVALTLALLAGNVWPAWAGAVPAAQAPLAMITLDKPTPEPTPDEPPPPATEEAAPPPTEKPLPPPTEPPPTKELPRPTEKPPGGKPTALPTPSDAKPSALPTPTGKPLRPTPVDAKPSVPPTPTRKGPAQPTPTAEVKPTTLPTPADLPTALPMAAPAGAPTDGATGDGHAEPVWTAADASSDASVVSPQSLSLRLAGLSPVAASGVMVGRVFDDRNKNGRPDGGEGGVPGVPVTLDGHVVAATDAGGRFSVPVIPDARLAIVPPQGWLWGGEALPAGLWPGEVAIPLQRAEVVTATTAAVTGGVALGSVLIVALVGGLVFNSLGALSQSAAVRSLEQTYRRQQSRQLELALARDLADYVAHLRRRLSDEPDVGWREALAQLLADAGLSVSLSYVEDVGLTPCPHFSVAGSDGRLYLFAADAAYLKRRERRGRITPLDVSVSHFARVEAQAVWEHLAASRLNEQPILARDAAWHLLVTRRPAGLKTRHGWLERLAFWKGR